MVISKVNHPRNENKMMTAEKVADHIYKAVERKKSKIILTLESKVINILNKFCSAWLDKLIYKIMAKEADSPFN